MIMNLVEIDLSKRTNKNKCDHPDIKTDGTQYLIHFDDHHVIARFSRQWFGLTFSWFWSASSLQLNTPGISGIWEITSFK